MNCITNGRVAHRTKCLSIEQAGAFARCLQGNAKFTEVSIAESTRAKSEKKWIVTFLPASLDRQSALVDGQQEKRQAKADGEGREYLFVLDKNLGKVFAHCFNPHSGETYTLDLNGCDCGDFTYRCHAAHLRCKHMIALEAALARGEVGAF